MHLITNVALWVIYLTEHLTHSTLSNGIHAYKVRIQAYPLLLVPEIMRLW